MQADARISTVLKGMEKEFPLPTPRPRVVSELETKEQLGATASSAALREAQRAAKQIDEMQAALAKEVHEVMVQVQEQVELMSQALFNLDSLHKSSTEAVAATARQFKESGEMLAARIKESSQKHETVMQRCAEMQELIKLEQPAAGAGAG